MTTGSTADDRPRSAGCETSQEPASPALDRLPQKLLDGIASLLDVESISSLRLTSAILARRVKDSYHAAAFSQLATDLSRASLNRFRYQYGREAGRHVRHLVFQTYPPQRARKDDSVVGPTPEVLQGFGQGFHWSRARKRDDGESLDSLLWVHESVEGIRELASFLREVVPNCHRFSIYEPARGIHGHGYHGESSLGGADLMRILILIGMEYGRATITIRELRLLSREGDMIAGFDTRRLQLDMWHSGRQQDAVAHLESLSLSLRLEWPGPSHRECSSEIFVLAGIIGYATRLRSLHLQLRGEQRASLLFNRICNMQEGRAAPLAHLSLTKVVLHPSALLKILHHFSATLRSVTFNTIKLRHVRLTEEESGQSPYSFLEEDEGELHGWKIVFRFWSDMNMPHLRKIEFENLKELQGPRTYHTGELSNASEVWKEVWFSDLVRNPGVDGRPPSETVCAHGLGDKTHSLSNGGCGDVFIVGWGRWMGSLRRVEYEGSRATTALSTMGDKVAVRPLWSRTVHYRHDGGIIYASIYTWDGPGDGPPPPDSHENDRSWVQEHRVRDVLEG